MPDYKKALSEGFEAARKADLAKKEVQDTLAAFKADVLTATDDKLLIEVKEFQEPRELGGTYAQMISGAFARAGEPRPKYLALAVKNRTSEASTYRELARWTMSKDGYPCCLSYGRQEKQLGNRVALENALADLLRDPRIGEILNSVLSSQ